MAHSLLNLVCSNSLIPRSFGSGAASILIKMRRSKCAKVASVSVTSRRSDSESKLKGAASNLEEDVVKSDSGIDEISRDPNRLSSMTVKELRELTRSVGIPSKGSKKVLMSALMTFSSRDQEGNDRPSKAKRVSPKNMSSKRKVDDSLAESDAHDVSSEADEIKQQGNRRKSQSCGSNAMKSQSISAAKQKTPVEKLEQLDQDASLMDHGEPWTQLAHKKPQAGWIPYNPRTMRPAPLARDEQYVKLMSWNVNGLRALLKLEAVSVLQLAEKEGFDVLCLQETKLKESDVKDIKDCLIEGYGNNFWTCSVAKLGYSGTAIISRMKPISVKYGLGVADHDSEGRLVTVEFDSFYLICAYVPNSGDGLKRLDYRVKQWDPSLSSYMKELERSKPVILTGDLNCAHEEIDIFNPAGNRRSAGFTWEERESFKENFLSKGFVDTFRKQHRDVVAYTYWGYRHGGRKTNKGWRLDYFLVSESIVDKAYDSYILPHVPGSDHCPIGLILRV